MINKYFCFFTLIFLCFSQELIANLTQAYFVPIHPEIVIDVEADQTHKEKALKEEAKKRFTESLNQQDIALFEESFTQAPIKIKALIFSMLKGEEYANRFKNILLTGPSGAGKSTLAQAIAYKLQRKCIVIHAPSLLGHYRDQAAENIRQLFKEIAEDEDKPVLVIDEINALTDGHTSEHSDTKHTAMQLWTLLDKFKSDKDFLLIGTTNITKKMPHQLQSRFEGKTFFVDNPSIESRKRALEFCIKELAIQKDESCTDAYFNELAMKTANFSMREIEALIDSSLLLYSIKNPNKPAKIISKEYLEQALSELIKEKEAFWDFTEQTTDEERRHRETLAQQAKHFEENKEFQITITEWNMIYQSLMKQHDRSSNAAGHTAITELNLATSIVFPNKKPATKIKTIPAGKGWGAEPEKKIIERNDEPDTKSKNQ